MAALDKYRILPQGGMRQVCELERFPKMDSQAAHEWLDLGKKPQLLKRLDTLYKSTSSIFGEYSAGMVK